jgi:hypothetical protein
MLLQNGIVPGRIETLGGPENAAPSGSGATSDLGPFSCQSETVDVGIVRPDANFVRRRGIMPGTLGKHHQS